MKNIRRLARKPCRKALRVKAPPPGILKRPQLGSQQRGCFFAILHAQDLSPVSTSRESGPRTSSFIRNSSKTVGCANQFIPSYQSRFQLAFLASAQAARGLRRWRRFRVWRIHHRRKSLQEITKRSNVDIKGLCDLRRRKACRQHVDKKIGFAFRRAPRSKRNRHSLPLKKCWRPGVQWRSTRRAAFCACNARAMEKKRRPQVLPSQGRRGHFRPEREGRPRWSWEMNGPSRTL